MIYHCFEEFGSESSFIQIRSCIAHQSESYEPRFIFHIFCVLSLLYCLRLLSFAYLLMCFSFWFLDQNLRCNHLISFNAWTLNFNGFTFSCATFLSCPVNPASWRVPLLLRHRPRRAGWSLPLLWTKAFCCKGASSCCSRALLATTLVLYEKSFWGIDSIALTVSICNEGRHGS